MKPLVDESVIQLSRRLEPLFEKSVREIGRFYRFSEEETRLFEDVDAAADELLPIEVECYLERKFNDRAHEIFKKHNIVGMPISKENGGRGANAITSVLAGERLGQVSPGGGIPVSISLGGNTIQVWGNEDQKERYLMPAVRAEILLAYALTEPDVGSNPTAIQTAYEEKDGHYVLNGTKYLISNGAVSDAVITFARSKETGEISSFIVDKHSEGFGVAMELKEKMGMFTSDLAMLEYRDVSVPKENLLGPAGKGLWVAYTALHVGRLGIAAACVGVIEDCLNSVVERTKERFQFGKPIGKHQLVQQHIANIATNLEMARWPTYLAAFKVMDWQRDPFNNELRHEADRATAIAKRVASRLAFESADRAVQVFGGFGYSLLAPPARHFLNMRAARLYEGTDEIMDLHIASGILGRDFEAYT